MSCMSFSAFFGSPSSTMLRASFCIKLMKNLCAWMLLSLLASSCSSLTWLLRETIMRHLFHCKYSPTWLSLAKKYRPHSLQSQTKQFGGNVCIWAEPAQVQTEVQPAMTGAWALWSLTTTWFILLIAPSSSSTGTPEKLPFPPVLASTQQALSEERVRKKLSGQTPYLNCHWNSPICWPVCWYWFC